MKAFTPVLPGSLPDPDDLGSFVIHHMDEPAPAPAGPNPLRADVSRGSTSFREALHALLKAHDSEIQALDEEVEKLRRKLKHEPREIKQVFGCSGAEQDQAPLFTHVSEGHLPRCEAQALGIASGVPNGEKPEYTADVNFSEVGEELDDHDKREVTPATITTRSATVEKAADAPQFQQQLSFTDKLHFQQQLPFAETLQCQQQLPDGMRRSSLRPSLLFAKSLTGQLNDLTVNERRWVQLVSDRYLLAQQHTNHLYERWTLSDTQLRNVCLHNANVDLWPAVERKRRKVRRHHMGRTSTIQGFSHIGSSVRGQAIKYLGSYELRLRRDYLQQYGCLAYVEKYHVGLPHSGSHLAWHILGMILISYDAVILPLQPFSIDENRGFFVFMKWFQAVYWSFDMILTFFTAVYVNVELVRRLHVIAHKYATSWLLFDLCILLPVWLEQVSSGGSEVADVTTLKVFRLFRFFRLVRLAKFTTLWDEYMKTISNPSLILFFKLLRLVLGLVIFTHVNGCLWYSVGKEREGWTLALADTDDLYKYLTSVHWTITQFSGTSEVAPGKFSAERAYAVSTVLMSILIFAIFLSNFTNIIMQLQALTVERDKQLRDLSTYMAAHRIPRTLSMKIRNYLSWKSNTDPSRKPEALSILPDSLKMEIEFEVCSPTLAHHEFFREFITVYPRLSRRVFHEGLLPSYPSPEDLVFCAQETNDRVWFTVHGLLDYAVILRRENEALTLGREAVHAGATLSEPTLWMQWQHRGTLMALSYSSLLTLSSEHFGTMIQTHPPAHASCNLYARRLIAGMAVDFWRCTDVIIPARLIHEDNGDGNFLDGIMEMNVAKLIAKLGGREVQAPCRGGSNLSQDSEI